MKVVRFIALLLIWPLALVAQEISEGPDFPPYPVPEQVKLKSGSALPAKVDLSKSTYFPSVINQHGWSCNQAGSIWYLLTYELNRQRNTTAKQIENRYSPLFTWNFLNGAQSNTGVSYFDSWEIVKAAGNPNLIDYPVQNNIQYWMSGYEKYDRAMQNRVIQNYSIQVGTPEGVNLLKRYLYDHFDGSAFGGLANFQIASGGMILGTLPESSADAGAPIITTFGSGVGHGMTIVGYNDSIKVDLNWDGRYTNDVDINNDRVIDLNDWEKGALIVYNSWGNDFGRNGMAYVPYHLLARFGYQGGFWNRSVHVVEVAKSYQPILTLRASLKHSCRDKIKIMAGVSENPDATRPDHLLEFPHFNYQGGCLPLTDPDSPAQPFELGLDITPLTAFIERGKPVRFFLVVEERDLADSEEGSIHSFGVYNHFGAKDSVLLDGLNIRIENNARTYAALTRGVDFNKIEVDPQPMIFAQTGQYVSTQFSATGAAAPYRWELLYDYDLVMSNTRGPSDNGTLIYTYRFGSLDDPYDLPFDFPYFGKKYRQLIIGADGQLLFEPIEKDYPYAIDLSLRFRSRKRIVPFGMPIDYFNTGNGVRYFTSDTVAIVSWDGMAPTNEGPVEISFCCKLYPDGRIVFEYSDTEFLRHDPGLTLGVSNGDNRLFNSFLPSDLQNGQNHILFNPARLPDDLRLDPTGWLFCRPNQPNTLYEVRVLIRDQFNLTATGSLFISTVNPDQANLLGQNHPNPFIHSTEITFMVPENDQVLLEVYDLAGRIVKTLINEQMNSMQYKIEWNGTNNFGHQVRPGVYLLRLISGDRKEVVKMLKINQ